jgi:hypothetical protein
MANTIILYETKDNENSPWLDTKPWESIQEKSNTIYFTTEEWNDIMIPSAVEMRTQLINSNCSVDSVTVLQNTTHKIVTFPFDTKENAINCFFILFQSQSANELMKERKTLIRSKYDNYSSNTTYTIETIVCGIGKS